MYSEVENDVSPALVSDECANSAGEDSDEDVITDYLAPTSPSAASAAASAAAASLSGGCWEGGLLAGPMAHQPAGGPLVPIISVTPHSPGSKHYPILGE